MNPFCTSFQGSSASSLTQKPQEETQEGCEAKPSPTLPHRPLEPLHPTHVLAVGLLLKQQVFLLILPWQSRRPSGCSPCAAAASPYTQHKPLSQPSANTVLSARTSPCLCALTLLGPEGCKLHSLHVLRMHIWQPPPFSTST